MVPYAAAKGAIVAVTLPMAQDLAPIGVGVCTIAPGGFLTPCVSSPQVQPLLVEDVLFPKRLGRPDEYALLVDTRTESQRRADGDIPGALVIDRTVLEWRLDPTSASHIAEATDHQVRVIVLCAQGYSSSLAAASLLDLGLVNATDVIGGFEAWQAARLPIAGP